MVAELPHIHGVEVGHLPWFFSGDVERRGQGYAVYKHTAANERYIELFDVVAAKPEVAVMAIEFGKHLAKII